VPRTGDAAVNNLAPTERTVLMLANVRDGRDFPVIFEDRHALAGQADNTSAVVGNVRYRATVNEAIFDFRFLISDF
jgi:hypothetical protein